MEATVRNLEEEALSLLRTPALWPETGIDQLTDALIILSLHLGVRYTEETFEEIRPFYWHVAGRTTVEQRLEVLAGISEAIGNLEAGLASLLPFLCADEEPAVISTAALNLSSLIPPREGDPLTGPKDVLKFLKEADTESSRAGILQGILLLGDRRVLPLLDRCWEGLAPEGRRILAHAWSGYVYASTIEFLLSWLESATDDREYGMIAGVLASYPHRSCIVPAVLDVERKFPAYEAPEGERVRILARWTFREYGRIIAPRLKALAERETGEKVIPKLMAAWGIVPGEKAASREEAPTVRIAPGFNPFERNGKLRAPATPFERDWVESFPPEKRRAAEIAVLYARAVNAGELEELAPALSADVLIESQSPLPELIGKTDVLNFLWRQVAFRSSRSNGNSMAHDVGRLPDSDDPCLVVYHSYGVAHQNWLAEPRCHLRLTLDEEGKLCRVFAVTLVPDPSSARPAGLFPGVFDVTRETGTASGIPPGEIELLLVLGDGSGILEKRARESVAYLSGRLGCLPAREIFLSRDLTSEERNLQRAYQLDSWPILLVSHRSRLLFRYRGIRPPEEIEREIRKVTTG